MKSRIFGLTTVSTLLIMGSCTTNKKSESATITNPPVAVEAIVAQRTTVVDTIVSSAPIQAVHDVIITSRGAGTITKTPMKLGNRIAKGGLALGVDDAVQQASVAQAKVAVTQAQLSFDVAKQLYDQGRGSKGELMGTETALTAAKAGLAMAKLNLENCHTVSPISGLISSVESSIQVGGTAAPGMMIGRVVDISQLKMTIYVGEDQIGAISVGDKVTITIGAVNKIIEGKVSALSAAANHSTGAFAVEILASNTAQNSVKIGMGGVAQIVTKQSNTGIVVPSTVVVERASQTYLWVAQSGKAQLRKVALRKISEGKTLVLSGISEKDTLIVTGISQMVENCPITPTLKAGK